MEDHLHRIARLGSRVLINERWYKTAATQYAPKLRVNCICPGWIATDMTAATIPQRGEALLARVPQQRFGEPEDIGEVACWLLPDRSRFVTGGVCPADGGYMAN